jgi:uncharacterized protein (TIGR03437 family)
VEAASAPGALFFFGGSTAAGFTSELWMLAPRTAAPIAITSVRNAFSSQSGAVAPGEIVSIYGTGLGPAEPIAFDSPLPSAPGVTVTVNGIPALLYFVSATQINAQIPPALAGAAEATLIVTVLGVASEPFAAPVAPAKPGLAPAILNQDASLNSESTPARAGSTITLFATGHATGPAVLTIGGGESEIVSKEEALPGVARIAARTPPAASPAEVVLRVGERGSPPVTVYVAEPEPVHTSQRTVPAAAGRTH